MRLVSTLIALALSPALILAQNYGIDTRPNFTAYNGGTLPANLPAFSGSWSAVPAFPNLTFQNIMGIHELPGQPANARKLVVYEREGRIHVVPRPSLTNAVAPFTATELNNTHKTQILDISNQCQGWDDAGLMSMAFHPDFSTNGYVYIYYMWVTPGTVVGSPTTRPTNGTTHKDRLARFTYNHGTGQIDPGSEQVLIDLTSNNFWHAGGGMFFHPTTGFLHMTFGDDTNGGFTQQITNNFRSSIIRIDVNMTGGSVSHPIPKQPVTPAGSSTANYYIPNDNPFVGTAGAMEEIFCLGLRSPHTMTYDVPSGRAFIGDVGEGTKEEISVVDPGESALNFQWNRIEGLNGDLTMPYIGVNKRPIIDYGRGEGTAVIGGRIYRAGEFASDLGGKYIFGDNVSGNVWYLDESTTPKSKVFLCTVPEGNGVNSGSDYRGISFFGTDNDNEFYICQLGTTSAQIYKLQRGGAPAPTMPTTLSATGLFSDVPTITPSSSFIPYDVNTPLWSDNAHKNRWFAIPTGQTIGYAATGNYTFPQGSVWLKHFELPVDDNNPATRKRLETRVLVRDDQGGVYGVTYKWRNDGTDADIVNGSETQDITINGTSEMGLSLTSTDIGAQVFDTATTNIGTGYEVTVRSGDIWNNSDNFRFLHAQKTGDFDARVRLESLSAAAAYTKAGIMARSTLDADSPHVYAMVFPTNAARNNNNGGHELQYRATVGGGSSATYPQLPHPRVSFPQTWLRLKREGNTFIHYWSDNGTTWKEYGRRTQTMPSTIYLGMATTSNTTGTATTTRFHLNLQRTQTWFYPGKADCLQCHRSGSGLVLGQNTAQSNRDYAFAAALNGTGSTVTDNQLRAWAHAGYFTTPPAEVDIPTLAKLRPLSDTTASAEVRMRSYLDSNCSHCHQTSGGGVHAFWDARYELTLAQTGIVNGFVGNTLGLTNTPKVLVPQSIDRSIMHHRMATATANHKMPPVAKSLVDQDAMAVLEQWINEVVQPPGDPLPSPWQKGDIGTVATAGDSTYFNGTYIVSSNGTDIGGTADSMHAATYQLVTGDGELVAQVSSISNSNANAKAGVMVRETLDANSKHGSTQMTYGNQALFNRRMTTGGTTVSSSGGTRTLPTWVKIRRRGPYIESFTSTDGTNWSLIGSDVISMAQSVYFCLVHSSGDGLVTGNATFDNVSVSPGIFGTGTSLAVNNAAANAVAWDSTAGITGTSVTNGPVYWYQNDTLNFTNTGGVVTLAGAMNMNTGVLNIDATTGNFSLTGGSLVSGSIRAGNGDNVTISSTLTGAALGFGALGVDATTGNMYTGTLTLNTSPTHTGTTTINSGVVSLNGNAVSLASGSGVTVNGSGLRIPATTAYPYDSGLFRGGLLQLTSGTADQFGSQIVTLNGGSLIYRNNANGDQTATVQNLSLGLGGNTLATAVQGGVAGDTLAITNLTRAAGATLEVRSAYGTLGGTGDLGRVTIANINGLAAANVNGILGGWAFAGSGGAANLSNAFATLTATGLAASTPGKASGATGGTLNSQALNAATSADNFLVNNNQTVDGNSVPVLTANSLIQQNDILLNNGAKLVIGSGGLMLRNASFWMQSPTGAGGKLTTGTTSGELFIHTPHNAESFGDMRVRVRIEDNGATPLILVKSGPGKVGLGGNTGTGTITNAYTGGTHINEGLLMAYDASALGTASVAVRAGGTLWIAGGINTANAISLSGFGGTNTTTAVPFGALRLDAAAVASGAITLVSHARVEVSTVATLGTLSGVVSGADASLEKTGPGILLLSNLGNTFGGNIIVQAGTLRANGLVGTGAPRGNLGNNSGSRTIAINSGATMDWTSNNIFIGAGGSASSLPRIVVNGGTMQSSRFNVIGHVTLNGGVLTQNASDTGLYQGYQILGDITVGGTTASTISSSNSKLNHLRGAGTTTITVADATASAAVDLTVSTGFADGSGDYAGIGSFVKSGAGTMLITANSTFTGTNAVMAGTLQLGNGGAAGSLGTGLWTNNGAIIVNRDTSVNLTFAAISGTGSYTQENGSVIFNAVNSFAGPTVVNGGTLQLNGGGGSGGLRGVVTINSGATVRSNAVDSLGYAAGTKVNTLNVNGGTLDHVSANNLTLATVAINMNGGTLQAVSGNAANMFHFFGGGTTIVTSAAATTTSTVNGRIQLRQNNTTFTVNDGTTETDLALSGPITNGGAEGNNVVIKAGTGTMSLGGANTYVGATNINAGTLALSGSLMSSITTNAATLAPQGSPSTTLNLTQMSGATLRHRLNGGTVGTGYDQMTVGGTVTVAGNLDIIAAPGITAGSFMLINKTSAGAISGTFTGLAEGAVFAEDGHTFKITYAGGDGNDLVLMKLTPIQVWRHTNYGTIDNTGLASDTDDNDGDGVLNLMEYATRMDPTKGDAVPAAATKKANEIEFIFTWNKDATDVTLIVEWSDTLTPGSWSTAGVSALSVASDNGTTQQLKAAIPAGAGVDRRFARLRVER
ncbi:MAG: autotransporter-associated beta strand repeat-containing protein [Verrucomicrobiota bacterium]